MPAPKWATSFPFGSNFNTGSSVDPTHAFAPQRSATQILWPSLSIATALVEPHVRPSGIFAQPSTVRYGFGLSLIGACVGPCAAAAVESHVAPSETRIEMRRIVCRGES